jgi:hypothetical protein
MFARLSIYDNVDLDLAVRLQEWFEALERNPFRDLPGYRGSMTLIDRDNTRVVGIGLYATAGHAHEAETLLPELYEQGHAQAPEAIRSALEMQPDSVGFYEIVHRD